MSNTSYINITNVHPNYFVSKAVHYVHCPPKWYNHYFQTFKKFSKILKTYWNGKYVILHNYFRCTLEVTWYKIRNSTGLICQEYFEDQGSQRELFQWINNFRPLHLKNHIHKLKIETKTNILTIWDLVYILDKTILSSLTISCC